MDRTSQDATEQLREYLSTKQVEQEYGVPSGTLRYWRHNNMGPASFAMGKKVVYRRSEVEAWIADQEQKTRRGGVSA